MEHQPTGSPSFKELLLYEAELVRRVAQRELSHPLASLSASIMSTVGGAVVAMLLAGVPITLQGVSQNVLPVLGGGLAGFLLSVIPIVALEPARYAKAQATRITVLEEREKDGPRARIEVAPDEDRVRFQVWNDGPTGTFRARYQFLDATPLIRENHLQPRSASWRRLSTGKLDSKIFKDDFDEFWVSFDLFDVAGRLVSFFAAERESYDAATDSHHMVPVMPEIPVEKRWLEIGVTITTDPPTPKHCRTYRIWHDHLEETTYQPDRKLRPV